jgi:hypothetical protein
MPLQIPCRNISVCADDRGTLRQQNNRTVVKRYTAAMPLEVVREVIYPLKLVLIVFSRLNNQKEGRIFFSALQMWWH